MLPQLEENFRIIINRLKNHGMEYFFYFIGTIIFILGMFYDQTFGGKGGRM